MASSFTSPLVVEDLEGGWRVVNAFNYAIGREGSAVCITVPAGFETDFASVPRIFWSIFPPTGKHGKAAVLHDYLYATQQASRVVADAIFLEAMAVLNVPAWRRWTMYLGVRLGGWYAWRQHQKKQ